MYVCVSIGVLLCCSWRVICKYGCRWYKTGSQRTFIAPGANWTVTCSPSGWNDCSSNWVR